MVNMISKVELLGRLFKKGEFEKLFNLVGIINQSDPNKYILKMLKKYIITDLK